MDHRKNLRGNRHENSLLQNAFNKYGESAFQFSVIELVDKPLLIEREQFWIDTYRAANREHGYNLAPIAGSALGTTKSEEARAKMRGRRNGRIGWIGDDGLGYIPLNRDKIAIVDSEDVDRLNELSWRVDPNGHAATSIYNGNGTSKTVAMHHFVLNIPNGWYGYKNGNILDNRKSNLVPVTRAEILQASPNRNVKNRTSQYRGVSFCKKMVGKVWRVQVRINGIKKYLGMYHTEIEAAKVYDAFMREHGTEHAFLNFP